MDSSLAEQLVNRSRWFGLAYPLLRRFEEWPESGWFAGQPASILPWVLAFWDLALCRDGQGDPEGALLYLDKFLSHWHEPDGAFPEIEEALFLYESLTGKPYVPEDD